MENINGLTYIPNIISEEKEQELLRFINAQPWQNSLKRKVQHYGIPYNYQTRRLDDAKIHIPTILLSLSEELKLDTPENIIINKYLPGEGIASHIDSKIFGDTIASLSLNSGIQMDFSYRNVAIPLYLEPRSLLVMSSDARHYWTHGIVGRKTDYVNNKKKVREERISITFRTIK